MRITTSLLLGGLLFACGCAGTYQPTTPRILNYNYTGNGNGVARSYQYGGVRKNKRYARQEVKRTRVVFQTPGSKPVALCIKSLVGQP